MTDQEAENVAASVRHLLTQRGIDAREWERQAKQWESVTIAQRKELDEMARIVGTETPIAAFDLVTTWQAEKAGYMDQLSTANHTLADMVNQYMSTKEGYITHEFMSAQEDAIEYLEDIGWLRAGELERYYWTDASGRATAALTGAAGEGEK